MSYASPTTILSYSNPYTRTPAKYVITTYLSNTQISQDTYYTYQDMQTAFGQLQQLSIDSNTIDQITVQKYDLVVPSAGPDS